MAMWAWLLSTASMKSRASSASLSVGLPAEATALFNASSDARMPREQISASNSLLLLKCE